MNININLDNWMAVNGYKYTRGSIRSFGRLRAAPVEFNVYAKVTVRRVFSGSGYKSKEYFVGNLYKCTLVNRVGRYRVKNEYETARGRLAFSGIEGRLGGTKELLG